MRIIATSLLLLALAVGIRLIGFRDEPMAVSNRGREETVAPRAPLMTSAAPRTEIQVPPAEDSWAAEVRALQDLAATSADAALARVAELADKHERRAAAVAVCLIVAAQDPARALTAAWRFEVGALDDEPAENRALEQLARRWAEADLLPALRWVGTLPADEATRRDRVLKGMVAAVATEAPAAAVRLVDENGPADNHVRAEAAIDTLRQWTREDLAAATRWVAGLPEGALRERGIDELAAMK